MNDNLLEDCNYVRDSAININNDSNFLTKGCLSDSQSSTEMYLHKCERCSRKYKHKSSLIAHLRNECGKEARFQCRFCSRLFLLKHHLKHHVIRKHVTIDDNMFK